MRTYILNYEKGVEINLKTSYLSSLEEKVCSIYQSLKISDPEQIYHVDLIEDVSTMLTIKIYSFDEPSEANNLGGDYRIFLTQHQSKQAIWQDFAHEFAHLLLHDGFQWSMNTPILVS